MRYHICSWVNCKRSEAIAGACELQFAIAIQKMIGISGMYGGTIVIYDTEKEQYV